MTGAINLNPNVIRIGLSWALHWSSGPILCMILPKSTRLVVVNDHRFVASWEWFEETDAKPCFFLIPPFVASTLTSPASWDILRVDVSLRKNTVLMTMYDDFGVYVLQWRWDPWTFQAPEAFQQMMTQPEDMVQTEYVHVADAVHLAVANLGRMEGLERIQRERLAMAIDFTPGRLSIDGRQIVAGDSQRYYFDPRLVIRGLEVARARGISFSMARIASGEHAILYINSEREQWQVRCAILSLNIHETRLPSYGEQAPDIYNGSRLSPIPAI